jgi:hypothetical protein
VTWSLARDVATSATWRQADRTEAATGRESLEWQAEETLVKDGLTVARARAHAIDDSGCTGRGAALQLATGDYCGLRHLHERLSKANLEL